MDVLQDKIDGKHGSSLSGRWTIDNQTTVYTEEDNNKGMDICGLQQNYSDGRR